LAISDLISLVPPKCIAQIQSVSFLTSETFQPIQTKMVHLSTSANKYFSTRLQYKADSEVNFSFSNIYEKQEKWYSVSANIGIVIYKLLTYLFV